MSATVTWSLPLALVLLLAVAVAVSAAGHLGTTPATVRAAARAVVQLGLVSLVILTVVRSVVWSVLFAAVMMSVAVLTSTRRIGAAHAWGWVLLAIAVGVLPTLGIIFATGAIPVSGPSLVAIAGIVIGGAMTATTLNARRCFAALREEIGAYEAALSLGLPRADAISEVIARRLPEALIPGLDQTRTVGLVTLPGAFVGVLLGGGSPVQAGAAQLLVLFGLLATQSIVVAAGHVLIRTARLLPSDLAQSLRP